MRILSLVLFGILLAAPAVADTLDSMGPKIVFKDMENNIVPAVGCFPNFQNIACWLYGLGYSLIGGWLLYRAWKKGKAKFPFIVLLLSGPVLLAMPWLDFATYPSIGDAALVPYRSIAPNPMRELAWKFIHSAAIAVFLLPWAVFLRRMDWKPPRKPKIILCAATALVLLPGVCVFLPDGFFLLRD